MSASDNFSAQGDPFAGLTRKTVWKARLQRWRLAVKRPFQPDRIDPDRKGPANLLLLGIDTLRADHLGLHGYDRDTSSNLDRLAGRGTVFCDVTAPAPWTLPSFSSALCGVMPGVHGAYLPGPVRNMDTQPPRRLGDSAISLARHLRGQGYRTAAFYSNQFFAFGLAESFDVHQYHNLPAGDLLHLAGEWIRRHADQPFFCFVLMNDPHEPTTPPMADLEPFLPEPSPTAEELRAYTRWGEEPNLHLGRAPVPASDELARARALKLAIYDATIRYVDRCIGDFSEKLKAWRLESNTMVSVFSDHGEEFLDHAGFSRQWDHDPRGIHGIGHGHTLFQELLHVPWVSWGPGVPAGVRSREAVSLCDLAPTLCDWLGTAPLNPAVPPSEFSGNLVGRSLAGPTGTGNDARLILSEAIAFGPDLVALRRGRWKLIAHRNGRVLALFDLLGGPEEQTDLAAANPEVVADLLAELARWRDSGLGASGEDTAGGSWDDLDETVRQRLKDLGYSE
jgi:arylsulfatase A-like enzyme